MFGVVLWCDSAENKAVIWCEDHGDLAFFRDEGEYLPLDAGDLVVFDVSCEAQFRYAHNPRRIQGDARPGLADALESTATRQAAPSEPGVSRGAQIIPFTEHRDGGRNTTKEVSRQRQS